MIEIIRPTLLLDEEKSKRKIRLMVERASQQKILLRPHFKTHQSHEIGKWFRDEGVTKITVSSIQMAEYFAADGWNDITVAFPLNPLEISPINKLAATITLNLCVIDEAPLKMIRKEFSDHVNIYIEIDNGYHRTGIDPNDNKSIKKILDEIEDSKNLSFQGFLSHAGHAYKARSKNEILEVHRTTKELMVGLGFRYRKEFPNLTLSVGDTPTCSVADDFDGLTEIRPGNFVFYDLTQFEIGSCTLNDISVCMACPIVAVYPERNELIVHGGAVHFSKDSLLMKTGVTTYGHVVRLNSSGWSEPIKDVYIKSLSQEHGIIHCPQDTMKGFNVGDVVGVLPVHSCLTADLMGSVRTLSGQKIEMMRKSD